MDRPANRKQEKKENLPHGRGNRMQPDSLGKSQEVRNQSLLKKGIHAGAHLREARLVQWKISLSHQKGGKSIGM